MKLTDSKVKALRGRKNRYIEWDESSGLGVRVSPPGRKSFVFMYRYDGRARMMTLGPYPKLSLSEARTKAAKAREEVSKGNDPGKNWVEKKRDDRKAPTIEGLVEEYLEKWAKPRKKTWREDERILYKDVIPFIGRRKAKDIKKRDVVLLLDAVVDRGSPISANKTYEILRKMFDFAVSRSLLEYSPCVGVEKPSKSNARDRILDENEIKTFWKKLEEIPITKGTELAFKLLLVLGQRRGETVSIEWKEIDLKKHTWTIPGNKSKNENPHKVPLPSLAMEILLEAKELAGNNQWVFPGISGDKCLSPKTISQIVIKHRGLFGIDHFTVHDLRRTMASLMTGMGVPRLTVSKVLNHSEGGTTRIYDRHTYDAEKLQALETWERKLRAILFDEKSKVVNLKR
jgi:integrase